MADVNLRVLVVDDNIVNQKVSQGLLTKLGCRVDIAADGLQAVEAVSTGSYGLILMDCHMPGMDGYAAAAEIRKREQAAGKAPTPILALTASDLPEDRYHCIKSGMNGFLPKPFTRADVEAALLRWCPKEGPPPPQPPSSPSSEAPQTITG